MLGLAEAVLGLAEAVLGLPEAVLGLLDEVLVGLALSIKARIGVGS